MKDFFRGLRTAILFGVTILINLSNIIAQDHPDPPGDPMEAQVIYQDLTLTVDYDDGVNGEAELTLFVEILFWGGNHLHIDEYALIEAINMDGGPPWSFTAPSNRKILTHFECTPHGFPVITPTVYEVDDGTCILLDLTFRGVGLIGGAYLGAALGGPGAIVAVPLGGYLGQRLGGWLGNGLANYFNPDDLIPTTDYTLDLDTAYILLNGESGCNISYVPQQSFIDPPMPPTYLAAYVGNLDFFVGPEDETYRSLMKGFFNNAIRNAEDDTLKLPYLAAISWGIDYDYEFGKNVNHAFHRYEMLKTALNEVELMEVEPGTTLPQDTLLARQQKWREILSGIAYLSAVQFWIDADANGIPIGPATTLFQEGAEFANNGFYSKSIDKYYAAAALLMPQLYPSFNTGYQEGDFNGNGALDMTEILYEEVLDQNQNCIPDNVEGIVPLLTDIGGISGGLESYGSRINNYGHVAGWAAFDLEGRAFLNYNCINHKDIGTLLNGENSIAYGINDQDQVVGESGSANSDIHAFLFDTDVISDLGTLGGADSFGRDINNNAEATGYSTTTGGDIHAFVWDELKGMVDIGTLGGNLSQGFAINDNSVIVGHSKTADDYQHAFQWDETNGIVDLGTLGANDLVSKANDVNNNNEIAGVSEVTSGTNHAFVYKNNAMIGLGTLGGNESEALGINDNGDIVGWANTSGGLTHAFIYDEVNGIRNLNDLIPSDSGWELVEARSINNYGEITGYGLYFGETKAFYISTESVVVSVDDQKNSSSPVSFSLSQNYPNPFNPNTTIEYAIPEEGLVRIKLYDILGREVKTLVNDNLAAGYYKINFNANNLPSGVYFYRLQAVPTGRQAGSFVETKKMVLMK